MNDLYSEVTQRIITALEQGTPPWICPWQDGAAIPSNLVSGKSYRGINVLMLSITAMAGNYTDNRWLTFRQANDLGTRIRKGEHGTPIVFYKLREVNGAKRDVSDGDETEKRVIPLLRSFIVFNASQLQSIPEHLALSPACTWHLNSSAPRSLSSGRSQAL